MSTSLQLPSSKKLFGTVLNQLCTASITSVSYAKLLVPQMFFHMWNESPMAPIPDYMVDVSTPQISERVVYPLYAQHFHGASWQWSDHGVRTIAQAHSAPSSRPLYGILLRSRFVSRNKIFRCTYFSMHFRIQLPLLNDFPLVYRKLNIL